MAGMVCRMAMSRKYTLAILLNWMISASMVMHGRTWQEGVPGVLGGGHEIGFEVLAVRHQAILAGELELVGGGVQGCRDAADAVIQFL